MSFSISHEKNGPELPELSEPAPVAGAIAGLVRFLPRFDADELIRRAPDFPGTQE